MKSVKKIISLLLVLTIAAAALVLPAAAASTEATAKPGETKTLTFEVKDVKGITGSYSIENAELAQSIKIEYPADNGLLSEDTQRFQFHSAEKKTYTISFKVKLASNATVGETLKIKISYETTVDGAELIPAEKTLTLTVKKASDPVVPPVVTPIDYSELLHQIEIAEGLQKSEYTSASWANLETALKAAYGLKTSKSQSAVDAGAKALADAIAALVKMDYSKLLEIIEIVTKFIEDDELGAKWAELYSKLQAAKELLTSGDQAAVDAAAAELEKLYNEMLELIKQYLENNKEIVEVEKEVPVEVEPNGPFCNIAIHQLWPILFIISAVLNVGFIALIVVYVVRRKKNQKDETPLVDYDIEDDKI